jgi:hypothetical protein
MGTICAAVPGQTYNFTITARCLSGNGQFKMNVSCSDWGTHSQYSALSESEQQVVSHMFGSNFETISGQYTVPQEENAWFLQGTLEFLNSTDYDVSLFSVKRQRTSETSDNFHLSLSGHWYNVSGSLAKNEMVLFSVDPQDLCDCEGVMNFTAFIQGNRYGMVNLVYREPVLLGMNARFRVEDSKDGMYNLSLTKTITRTSAVDMMIWNSKVFQKFPGITELLVRFLMKGGTGCIFSFILKKIIPDISATFILFPFSSDPMYEQVTITADDDSGMKHQSANGNLWFSCSSPTIGEKTVIITLPES